MPMRNRATMPSTASRMLIRIDSYNAEGMRGVMRNPYMNKSVYFHDLVDFANKLDGFCDEMSFPQASATYRRFAPRGAGRAKPPKRPDASEAAAAEPLERAGSQVFVIHVQFRQNATWQGTVRWHAPNQEHWEHRFQSTLELFRLMDSVLSQTMPAVPCDA